MRLPVPILVSLVWLSNRCHGSSEPSQKTKLAVRWVTAQPGDQNGPYFVGYLFETISSTTSWVGWDCNPGATYTTSGHVANCVQETVIGTNLQTSCSASSVLVGGPSYTPYTCPGGACVVGTIYQDFGELQSWSIISCQGSQYSTFTMYRETSFPQSTTTATGSTSTDTISSSLTSQPELTTGSTTTKSEPAGSPTNGSPSSSGFSDRKSTTLGLGLGLGLGISGLVLGGLALWLTCRRRQRLPPTAATAPMQVVYPGAENNDGAQHPVQYPPHQHPPMSHPGYYGPPANMPLAEMPPNLSVPAQSVDGNQLGYVELSSEERRELKA